MSHHRPSICLLSILFLLFINLQVKAQDAAAGRTLFMNNCASCHSITKPLTGPALAFVESRVTDKKLLHDWIRNNGQVLKSGNVYFVALFNQYEKKPMNTFPNMTDAEITNIPTNIRLEESKPPPIADQGPGGKESSDNSLVFGIITLIMALIALILLQVNSSLRKMADDKEGIPAHEPLPFYRNKTYI